MDVPIGDFLCLRLSAQFFLLVLEANRHIRGTFGPPEEIEVLAVTLALIGARDCTEDAV